MNRNLKVFCAAILIASLFTQDEICKHLGFGQASFHNEVKELKSESEPVKTSGAHEDVTTQMKQFIVGTNSYWIG
jgi:hypothetical protein